MHEEVKPDKVKLAVTVPPGIRAALHALKLRRELEEGRPVHQGEIVAELIVRAARESERA
jgi:hypothetical protein